MAGMAEQFTLEHWLYLFHAGRAPQPPTELAPWPLAVTEESVLAEQLREWGLTDEYGQPTGELDALMSLLTTAEVRVWGAVRFPLRSETVTYELNEEQKSWGLDEEVLVVPRVPMMVAWTEEHTAVVQSTPEALTVEIFTSGEVTADVTAGLLRLLDPEREWKPRRMPPIRVPREVVADTGMSLADGVDVKDARGLFKERMAAAGVTGGRWEELAVFAADQPYAIAQFAVTVTDGTRTVTAEDSALAVTFTAAKEPTAVVVGSARSPMGAWLATFEGLTEKSLATAVGSLVREGRGALRKKS